MHTKSSPKPLLRAQEHTEVSAYTQTAVDKHRHAHALTNLGDIGQSFGLIQAWWRPNAFHGSWLPDILSAGSADQPVHSGSGGRAGDRKMENER